MATGRMVGVNPPGPTGRHAGAACVASGLPAERSTCNWWAASVLVAAFVPAGHQRKLPAGKPLVAKPKTLAVVDQDLQRRRRPVAKHEHPAAERIVFQHVFAQPGQAVDPAAKIGRLDGRHDPHLRRDLDHGSGFQKLRLSAARSGVVDALQMDPHLRPGGVLQLQSAFARADPTWEGPVRETWRTGTLFRLTRGGSSFLFDPFLERVVVHPQRLGGSVQSHTCRPSSPPRPTTARECATGPLRVRRQCSNRRRTPSSRAGRSRVFLVPIGCPPQVRVLTAHDTTPLKTIHTRLPEGHD